MLFGTVDPPQEVTVMAEQLVGHVTHWFGRNMVAGIHVDSGSLHVGDTVHILGHTSEVEQPIASMELDHVHIQEAHAGEDIGIVVADHVREGDKVYLVAH
jgi:translation elongation factor EF-Tu-like GTPase